VCASWVRGHDADARTVPSRPWAERGSGSKTTWHPLVIFKEGANVENTLKGF